eukprot:TRINITY_DN3908_c0_g1_i1.p1 TRINITY_DN3908_c0_g1~~TRINITY_DN3908_c0_g1_i1.p1  ORF type:complete len:173 (-),score=39.43 TRINITY_DN3908_c0_g1_i1:244-762(-)
MEKTSLANRPFDLVLLFYFVTHIPATLLVDLQSIIPRSVYPIALQELVRWYSSPASPFNDPYFRENPGSPIWLQAFTYCELFFQLPFFFFAIKSILTRDNRIRIPGIIYGAHVATTLAPILFGFWVGEYAMDLTQSNKIALTLLYLPYLIIPLLMVFKYALNPTPYGKDKAN